MTKKLLKNSLLLFLFGIITLSCSLENEAVHQHEHSKKASYQRKMYDELILDKNFSKAIKQIPKKNVLASSSLNRTVMEEQYGFTIFDAPINVMETDSVISYNLCIQTDSLAKGDFFENLVINSNKFTNTIDAYLVKYNLLSEITPSAHGSFSFDFEPEIKPINYDASTARAFTWCYSYHYEMCHELVPGTQYESPHTPTEACNQQSLIYTHTETRCIVIGESGGTGDSGAFESSSSGTSGQSSDPYNNGQSSYGNNTIIINPNPLTGPTPSELKRIREQCFLNTFLSTAQSNWLKSPANAQTRNAIYDYLATQTNYGSGDDLACYTNEGMGFAQEALIALMNGGEVDFALQIILDPSFKNNPRLKCIWDKINSGNNTINDYLQKFKPQFSVAHLRFKNDINFNSNYPTHSNAGAITVPPNNYIIDIIVNSDPSLSSSSQNFPSIIIALEIIHETIHAEMFRKLMECAGLPHVNYSGMTEAQWENFMISLMNNYPGLHDYFLRYEYNTSNPTDSHHEMMAQSYIDIMSEALKDFDNNAHNDEFYEALSWIGLKETVAWDNLSPTEQNNINLTIQNAITNETYNCTN